MFVSVPTAVYPVWVSGSPEQIVVIHSCTATCKKRLARSKLPFEPAIFVRPANSDAEGVMTDATVGVGSHQGRFSTSIYRVQVWGRSVDVSHWHSKPSSWIAPFGIAFRASALTRGNRE